jgi:hypothetical protein
LLLFSVSAVERLVFGTVEVIEAKSQAVLNTRTEYNLQDGFKKRQNCWEQSICIEGDYFEGDCGW